MLSWALGRDEPVIIRYPKAACPTEQSAFDLPLETGKGVFTQRDGADILIACTGGIYAEVHEAANMLARSSLPVDTYNLRFIKPLDEDFLVSCASGYRAVLFVEDGSETGGIASDLASIVRERLPHVLAASMAFPDIFYPQGTRQEILSFAGLSAVHIYDEALKLRSYIAAGQSR